MEDYLHCIRALANALFTSSEPLKKSEIIDHITRGFGIKYNNFVTNLFSKQVLQSTNYPGSQNI